MKKGAKRRATERTSYLAIVAAFRTVLLRSEWKTREKRVFLHSCFLIFKFKKIVFLQHFYVKATSKRLKTRILKVKQAIELVFHGFKSLGQKLQLEHIIFPSFLRSCVTSKI